MPAWKLTVLIIGLVIVYMVLMIIVAKILDSQFKQQHNTPKGKDRGHKGGSN